MAIHSGDFFGRKRKILLSVKPEILRKILQSSKKAAPVKIPPPPDPVRPPPVDEFWRKPPVNKTPLTIRIPVVSKVEAPKPIAVEPVEEKPLTEKEKRRIAFLKSKLNYKL